MQSDRNSSKTETFHVPTAYEPHFQTSSEQIITFAGHKYGRLGVVFIIKIIPLVQMLQPFKKCKLSNCSHLIASHCNRAIYFTRDFRKNKFSVVYVVCRLNMSPPEWIRQPEWIDKANIHFFKHCKRYNVRICNPTIFALHTLGVKMVFSSLK